MYRQPYWLDRAKQLELDRKERYRHCGEGYAAVLSRDVKGYSMHCFRCGEHEFHGKGLYTLDELKHHQELRERAHDPPKDLPRDFTPVIPTHHATWLFKAGISTEQYTRCGIGWSEYHSRIILPIYDGDRLVYWQGRAVLAGQLPKYINPPGCKQGVLYHFGDHRDRSRLIVTEDILSCIRVGKHLPSVSILGTSTSDEQAGYLCQFDLVEYWLDPDEAGIAGSKKGASKMALATKSNILTSHKDPKNLSDRVLRSILGLSEKRNYIYHGYVITPDA